MDQEMFLIILVCGPIFIFAIWCVLNTTMVGCWYSSHVILVKLCGADAIM